MSESPQRRDNLRQMIAVLQAERQALAGLDLDAIMGCANEKVALCGTLDACGPFADGFALDEECRGLESRFPGRASRLRGDRGHRRKPKSAHHKRMALDMFDLLM